VAFFSEKENVDVEWSKKIGEGKKRERKA